MLPFGDDVLKGMFDGTWQTCGPWGQHITVKFEIKDEEGERFEHVMSIFVFGKAEEDYRHAFACMFAVLDDIHNVRIRYIVAQTDCESAIHNGLQAAGAALNILVHTTYCSIHIQRAVTKGLKKACGLRTISSCVNVTVSVINSLV